MKTPFIHTAIVQKSFGCAFYSFVRSFIFLECRVVEDLVVSIAAYRIAAYIYTIQQHSDTTIPMQTNTVQFLHTEDIVNR